MSSNEIPPPFKHCNLSRPWILLVLGLALSCAYSWYYFPLTIDDAMISYRYSDRLLQGKGLTWNDGEFVEGYSNLLWVLLVSAGGLLDRRLILVGKLLCLASNAATLSAVFWAFSLTHVRRRWSLIAALLVLALSGSFAVSGVGGMETALAAALLAWALATTYRMPPGRWGWLCPAVLLGLLSITRPDGIVFGACVASALLLRDGVRTENLHRSLGIILVPVIFILAQTVFRLWYYGKPLPNTAYIKLALTVDRIRAGADYIGWGALANVIPLVLCAVTAIVLWRNKQRNVLKGGVLFFLPGAVWLTYVTIIGGDIFPGIRHWVPALVCLSFLFGFLVEAAPTLSLRSAIAILACGSVIQLIMQAQTVDNTLIARNGKTELYHDTRLSIQAKEESECIALGELLKDAFWREQPVIAVNVAGAIPYVSGFPSIDMLGLNDAYIAHHRPGDVGEGIIGHEFGDGAYVLSRRPDIAQFHGGGALGTEPFFRGEKEMVELPEFQHSYRVVYFRAGGAVSPVWVRAENGRIGIVRTSDRISIPGFLLASTPNVYAILSKEGVLAATLSNSGAILRDVYIPAGLWKVSVVSDESGNRRVAMLKDDHSTNSASYFVRIARGGALYTLHMSSTDELIYGVSLTRVSDE